MLLQYIDENEKIKKKKRLAGIGAVAKLSFSFVYLPLLSFIVMHAKYRREFRLVVLSLLLYKCIKVRIRNLNCLFLLICTLLNLINEKKNYESRWLDNTF